MTFSFRFALALLLALTTSSVKAQEYPHSDDETLIIDLDKQLLNIDVDIKWLDLSISQSSLSHSIYSVYNQKNSYSIYISSAIESILISNNALAIKHVYSPIVDEYVDFSTDYLIVFNSESDAMSAQAALANLAGVKYVFNVKEVNDSVKSNGGVEPNDGEYLNQWELQRRAPSGTSDPARFSSNMVEAWEYLPTTPGVGNTPPVVGVYELYKGTPINDYNGVILHPDLENQVIGDIFVDNDGCHSTNAITTHALAVTGIVAAKTNNESPSYTGGIASAGYGAKARLIQVCGFLDGVNQFRDWITNEQVDVLNFSWSSSSPYSGEVLEKTLISASNRGIILVQSGPNSGNCAGDDNLNGIYPASIIDENPVVIDNTIIVQAITRNGNIPGTSTSPPCDSNVWDITAPGREVTSLSYDSSTSTHGTMSNFNGTSFASPMVASMVTLYKHILSQYDVDSGTSYYSDVLVDSILRSGDYIGNNSNGISNTDPTYWGNGVVNAYKFMGIALGQTFDDKLKIFVEFDLSGNEVGGIIYEFEEYVDINQVVGNYIFVGTQAILEWENFSSAPSNISNNRASIKGVLDMSVTNCTSVDTEIFCRPNSSCSFDNPNCPVGQNSCIVAEEGSVVEFGSDQTFENGGFLIAGGAEIIIDDGVTVTLDDQSVDSRIDPGTEFQLGLGSSMILNTLLDWSGTSSEPISVTRLIPTDRWGSIELRADGNHLEHVIIDGGYKNLDIRSRGNTLNHVTSRNGYYNLATGLSEVGQTLQNSEVTITKSLFEDAAAAGMFLYSVDASIDHSIIRDGIKRGVYVSQSNVSSFVQNEVYGTGDDAGIEIHNGGTVSMNSDAGNIIRDNYGASVVATGSGRLYAGSSWCSQLGCVGGRNSFPDGPPVIVDNQSSYAIGATENFWGDKSPEPYWVSGSVDYSDYLQLPPPNAGAGSGVGAFAPSTPASSSFARGATTSANKGGGLPSETSAALLATIQAVRAELVTTAAGSESADLAAYLYYLHGLDSSDELREWRTTESLFQSYQQALIEENPGVNGALAERAGLAMLDVALRTVDRELAQNWIEAYSSSINSELGKSELAAAQVTLAVRDGEYQAALDLLSEHAEWLGEDYVVTHREFFLSLMGEREGRGELAKDSEAPSFAKTAQATGLLAPYPNPSSGQFSVPFALAEAADVRIHVYDVTGRMVATLSDRSYEAGAYETSFDGSSVAPGVYLVRSQINEIGGESLAETKRLTVIR